MNAFDVARAQEVAVGEWRKTRWGVGNWRPDPREVLLEAANNLVYRAAAEARSSRAREALVLIVAADLLHGKRHSIDARAGASITDRLQVRSSP